MRSFIILSCVLATLAVTEAAYSDKYDNIDVKEILANERLTEGYFKCLMEEGPCTNEGSYLKEILPKALKDGCAECSDIQKEKAEEAIRIILERYREYWIKMTDKYDSTGEYRKKYESLAKEKNIDLP